MAYDRQLVFRIYKGDVRINSEKYTWTLGHRLFASGLFNFALDILQQDGATYGGDNHVMKA